VYPGEQLKRSAQQSKSQLPNLRRRPSYFALTPSETDVSKMCARRRLRQITMSKLPVLRYSLVLAKNIHRTCGLKRWKTFWKRHEHLNVTELIARGKYVAPGPRATPWQSRSGPHPAWQAA
jgi:hypothetical protein